MGKDTSVALQSGEAGHIGAVAVSQARPSLSDDGSCSATTSVIALLGHKEDELARAVASRLARALGGVVSVACGVHLDAIRPEELRDVAALAEELAEELAARLASPEA